MPASRLEYLFDRYINQSCTLEEKEELMALLEEPENIAAFESLITRVINNTGSEMQLPEEVAGSILQNIFRADKARIIPLKKRPITFFPWMRVAVMFLLLAGAAYWLYYSTEQAEVVLPAETSARIVPGRNKAMLTTSDGQVILLDSLQNGKLLIQGSTRINKQHGLLIYEATASTGGQTQVVYNTLSTPRGGQYQVVLPDGSRVWLNAASALRFPVAFTGNRREVELTGEAYFEVVKHKKTSFQVNVSGMRIDVLGTDFNISAYPEENAIKTSLLEGSVKVIQENSTDLLKPGQQAVLNKKKDKIKITDADMNEVIAWKNGLFHFEGADIITIMRQIGRWYDVEIVFPEKIPVRHFQGKIRRDAQLSEVLQILELSKVKFTVDGNKIIVK